MKLFNYFIWAGFLASVVVFVYYGQRFDQANGILAVELAGAVKGESILLSWEREGLFSLARALTWFDFVFILFYACLLFILSNRQIRKESSFALNALLRANFLLVIATALLDVTENILLLYNLAYYRENAYIPLCWVAWPKFILAGWAVLVWLISTIKTSIEKK